MSTRSLLHVLMLGVLAVCVGGLGPATLASVPRSLTYNTQEEERNAAESDAIGALGTSVLRPSRPSPAADRGGDRLEWPCASVAFVAGDGPFRPGTLCDLHVRMQV
jgi:hypothetical protein